MDAIQEMTPGPWLTLVRPEIDAKDGTVHVEVGLQTMDFMPGHLIGARDGSYLSLIGICRPADIQAIGKVPELVMTLLAIASGGKTAAEYEELAHVTLQLVGVMES